MTTRAQSEALGFVLVFSLIMLTVGTVYVAGFESLDDSQQDAQNNNMERAFDVLADNLRDIYREGAPRRATEVKLGDGDGALTYRNETTIRLSLVDLNNESHNATLPQWGLPVDTLLYRSDGTEVAYEGGAVIRARDGRSRMTSPPGWVVSDDRAVVPLVLTDAVAPRGSYPGPNTVLVRSKVRVDRSEVQFVPEGDKDVQVNVTVTSPYAEAWDGYFESEGFRPLDGDPTDGTVTYQFNTSRVTVVSTGIQLAVQP